MQLLTLLILLVAVSVSALGQTTSERELPADFKSDACSLFPDGNYAACCVEHDKAYYFGGSSKERKTADNMLYECVRKKRNKFTARLMWFGVRIGGVSFLPTPFRWGFGNKWPRSKPKTETKPKQN
jgi:hypothetical protein